MIQPFYVVDAERGGSQNAIDYYTHHNCNNPYGGIGFMAAW